MIRAFGEIVPVLSAIVIALGAASRRLAADWPTFVRFMIVLDLLDARESPARPVDLFEVVLVDPAPTRSDRSIAFVRVDRADEIGELVLDLALGERADLCAAWSTAKTPLVYAGDCRGGAVLQGPLDRFVGHVECWHAVTSRERS